MTVRSKVAAVVVLALVAQPFSAHAQVRASAVANEIAASDAISPPVQWIRDTRTPIDLHVSSAWGSSSLVAAPRVSWFSTKPDPIRLSKTAITWIIIGGVVLVVLVVAGVAVLGKPGRVH